MRNQQKARQLIDEGFLDELEKQLKSYYVNMWHRQQDAAKREQLWLAYNMVDDLRVAVSSLAQAGELKEVPESGAAA